MTGTPTTKHGLAVMAGTDTVNTIDNTNQTQMAQLDALIAVADKGALSGRPTSTGGTPGKSGRFYYATDTGQLFFDHGTSWIEITEATQGTLSARPAAGVRGRAYTDQFGTIWRDSGSAWLLDGGAVPHCHLHVLAVGQSIPDNTETDIAWTTEVEDALGMHAASAATVTIPYSGLWRLELTVAYSSNATGTRRCAIYNNAGTDRLARSSIVPGVASVTQVAHADCTRRFAAGTVLRTTTTQTSGGALSAIGDADGDESTNFRAVMVGS